MTEPPAAEVATEDVWPAVAVVLALRDAADGLDATLAAISAQDYPASIEVVAAVAPSADDTDEIVARWAARDARIRVIPNPDSTTPAGLNAAIAATSAPIVARVDGHATIPPTYLRGAVEALGRTEAAGVGGIQQPVGRTPIEQAVAVAMASPLGSGGAAYRGAEQAREVETVYLGVYPRRALETAGGYDPAMVRNQDAELNWRLRTLVGPLWLEPSLVVAYRPRGSWWALARQYHDYGRWRAVTARRHRGSLAPRQLAPVVAVVGLLGATLVAMIGRRSALGVWGAYIGIVAAGSVTAADVPPSVRWRIPIALAVMHLAWGTGFLWSLVDPPTDG